MLHQYRYRLAEPGVRSELGFLFDGYTHDMWWFELADMAHKLCLTSLVVFLPFNAQMPFAMGPSSIPTQTVHGCWCVRGGVPLL